MQPFVVTRTAEGSYVRTIAGTGVLEGSGLISEMLRAQQDGDRLLELEIVSLCVQLMVAGNVTTSDLMGNGLFWLASNPSQRARFVANPSLMEQAVEEMPRYDCPITETARIATEDADIGGCPVHPGDTVEGHIVPLIGSGRAQRPGTRAPHRWLEDLEEPGEWVGSRLGATSIRLVRKVLSMAPSDAVVSGLLTRNPVAATSASSPVASTKQTAWTLDEARRFLAVDRNTDCTHCSLPRSLQECGGVSSSVCVGVGVHHRGGSCDRSEQPQSFADPSLGRGRCAESDAESASPHRDCARRESVASG